jgi:hypothetical protein
MSANGTHMFAQVGLADFCREDEDVVEIPLLIPNWQAEALENAAHQQGLTAGELIRQLLLDYLSRHAGR